METSDERHQHGPERRLTLPELPATDRELDPASDHRQARPLTQRHVPHSPDTLRTRGQRPAPATRSRPPGPNCGNPPASSRKPSVWPYATARRSCTSRTRTSAITPATIRRLLGMRHPLHSTSPGKAIGAALPRDATRRARSRAGPTPDRTSRSEARARDPKTLTVPQGAPHPSSLRPTRIVTPLAIRNDAPYSKWSDVPFLFQSEPDTPNRLALGRTRRRPPVRRFHRDDSAWQAAQDEPTCGPRAITHAEAK